MDTNAPSDSEPKEYQPRKYVRTFEGDKQILREGGKPDLMPLVASHSDGTERFVTASPLPPVQTKLSEPEPALQLSVKESVPPEEPQLNATPLETYAGDFSDRMKETHASAVTVLAAEQDSAKIESQISPKEPPHNHILYGIVGTMLLIIGVASVYGAHMYYAQTTAPVALPPSISAPIFVDDREGIWGSGDVLMQMIKNSVATPIATGSVRLLYMASSTNSVFSNLSLPAPDILLRNIQTSGSMAGVVDVGGVQSPFFILSVTSYSDTFSGMLSWEPMMRRDLITIFPPYPVSTATTTATTTTTIAPAPAFPAPLTAFTDDTVANHDVRVYRDSEGRSIILYGYWNPTTLVIARDPASFTEIIQRLATSRTQ
ncbi:MAG TPA: hypothetical protein VNF51_03490 [Candidatus Paceibacterota bacterium]|nr:hypothetical protein [Candidatus Paceibacterota bacterium]